MLLIFPSGDLASAYEDTLRNAMSPPQMKSADDFRAYEQKYQQSVDDLPLLFSQARYARADGNGVIACRGVQSGRYDIVLTASGARSGQSGSRIHYFVAHAAVPSGARKDTLVRMTSFSEIGAPP